MLTLLTVARLPYEKGIYERLEEGEIQGQYMRLQKELKTG